MLAVSINQPQFEYDIHSLVKAFYPAEEIKVFCGEECPPVLLDIQFKEEKIILTRASGEGATHSFFVSEVSHEAGIARTDLKNLLKQLIYHSLEEATNKQLPWGTLTGIRPTKIAMGMMEEGLAEEEILARLEETYLISREKGELSCEIARREKDILSAIHYQNGYSLYIGIPFCPTTCLYCSFTSYPIALWKQRVDAYLEALEKELSQVASLCKDKVLDTIYIGGGTPTTLEKEELERLLLAVERNFQVNRVLEYTVEAGRADSITREKLQVLKRHGITRISVNPQTMKEETLALIGRQHTVAQVKEAFLLAREEGFDNINMDIILGLPGETKEDVEATLREIEALKPDSLTVHSLAIKRASGMKRFIEENGIATLNNTDETMLLAAESAKKMGMEPYYLYRQKNMSGNFENVGYAAEGKHGIYNILIMEEKQAIAAVGAGSISKVIWDGGRIERSENVKDVALYIERIEEMRKRKERLFLGDKI